MKTIIQVFKVFRWIVAILILFFSVSTLIGGSYGQTLCMVFIATFLVFWPSIIEHKLNRKVSIALRILFIVLLIAGMKTVFKSDPKSSICLLYTSDAADENRVVWISVVGV